MIFVDGIKIEQGWLTIKKNGQWIDQECIYKNNRCGLACPAFAIKERDQTGIYLGCLKEYIVCYKQNFKIEE